jgi:hypothetical protein
LNVVGSDTLLVDPCKFLEDVKVDSFGLDVRNASFSLEHDCRSDALNFFHDSVFEDFLDDFSHKEFFQAQRNFHSDFAAVLRKSVMVELRGFKFFLFVFFWHFVGLFVLFHTLNEFFEKFIFVFLFPFIVFLFLQFFFSLLFFNHSSSLDFSSELIFLFDPIDVIE